MKVKRYHAGSMQEGLMMVRRDLGPEAIILNTRSYTRGGFLGFFGTPMVEITAALKPASESAVEDKNSGMGVPQSRTDILLPAEPPSPAELMAEKDSVKDQTGAEMRRENPPSAAPKQTNELKPLGEYLKEYDDRILESDEIRAEKDNSNRKADTPVINSGPVKAYMSQQKKPPLPPPQNNGRSDDDTLIIARKGDKTMYQGPERRTRGGRDFPQQTDRRLASMQEELKHVRKVIEGLVNQAKHVSLSQIPQELSGIYLDLMKNEVSDEIAQKLISTVLEDFSPAELSNLHRLMPFIEKEVAALIPEGKAIKLSNDKTRIVALVGPTGVGKTTTIAKVAGNLIFPHRKRIAFISADTYRLAAADQLRMYGDILKVPVEVVYTPNEMRQKVNMHMDRDLILIDTAGRSQRNSMQMSELISFLDAAGPDEVHLVLSATTKLNDLIDILEKFEQINYNKLIFSKLDESTRFGNILNVGMRVDIPISYLTTGQNVPDDIELCDSAKLAKLICQFDRETAPAVSHSFFEDDSDDAAATGKSPGAGEWRQNNE